MPFPSIFSKKPAASTNHPQELSLSAKVEVLAAANGEEGNLPTFEILAYSGSVMNLEGFFDPVIVDLEGITFESEKTPIIHDHDVSLRIGHCTKQTVDASGVKVSGVVSSTMGIAKGIAADAKAGFPFQASIGARIQESSFVKAGETVSVNGQELQGPLIVARKAVIKEISICVLGADSQTQVAIAASHKSGRNSVPNHINALRASMAEETERIDRISKVASQYGGRIESVSIDGQSLPLLQAKSHAMKEGMSADAFELSCLRASYGGASGPGFNRVSSGVSDASVIECGLALHAGLNVNKIYPEQVCYAGERTAISSFMDAARLCVEASGKFNSINPRDKNSILKAAFSTSDFSSLLSNIANKSAEEVYADFPSVAAVVARKLEAKNFHTHTGFRLDGDVNLLELGQQGEIKHTRMAATSYNFEVQTYARMWSIDRTSLINDDTQALNEMPKMLARGAMLTREEVFWNVVLSNANNFFHADNGNLLTGAGSALGADSLAQAVAAFLEAVDANGKPIAVRPKYLIVPPALSVLSDELYAAREFRPSGGSTTDSNRLPTRNTMFGKYEPHASPWIGGSQALTGGSDTHWYLFGDPSDLAPFGLAYLNGTETPVIEECDLPGNVLGIGLRAYFDIGACQMHKSAAVRSTGS